MTNNDILRRLRYSFSFDDNKVMELFASGGLKANRTQISAWLKKDDDPACIELEDVNLAAFLNGFINEKRGKKDGPQPKPESELNNNLIFMKLRIALNLKDDDILAILKSVDLIIGKPELSAFFRRYDHKNRRHCKDQVLRNFLHGVQIKYHSEKKNSTPPKKAVVMKEKTTTTKKDQPTLKWASAIALKNSTKNNK